MAKDVENQDEPTVVDDADATRYWDEAVSVRVDGKDAPEEPSETETEDKPVEQAEEPSEEAAEVEQESSEPETESTDTEDDVEEETDAQQESDPFEGVPAAFREKYVELEKKAEKFEHSARSNAGRLGALQKKIDDLSRKLDEKQSSGKDDKVEPPVDPGDTIFKTPTWEKFREDFGDVAIPIEDAIRLSYKDLHSRLEDTQKVSQSLQETREHEEWGRQAERLESEWPNWEGFIRDNAEDFNTFVNATPYTQELMKVNADVIRDAQAGKFLLTLFRDHLHEIGKLKSEPASSEAKPKPEPRELSPKRRHQLKSAATVAPRSVPGPGSRLNGLPAPDDDPEVLWNWAAGLSR